MNLLSLLEMLSWSLNVILSCEKRQGFSFHFQTLPAVSLGQCLVHFNLATVFLISSHISVSFPSNTSLFFSPIVCLLSASYYALYYPLFWCRGAGWGCLSRPGTDCPGDHCFSQTTSSSSDLNSFFGSIFSSHLVIYFFYYYFCQIYKNLLFWGTKFCLS